MIKPKSIINLLCRLFWSRGHLQTALCLNMVLVMANTYIHEKAPCTFRSGGTFLPMSLFKGKPLTMNLVQRPLLSWRSACVTLHLSPRLLLPPSQKVDLPYSERRFATLGISASSSTPLPDNFSHCTLPQCLILRVVYPQGSGQCRFKVPCLAEPHVSSLTTTYSDRAGRQFTPRLR